MEYLSLILGIGIGCFLGGIAVYAFFGRRKVGHDGALEIVRLQTQLEEQKKYADEMQERMNETFAKISQDTVDQNSKNFLQLEQ